MISRIIKVEVDMITRDLDMIISAVLASRALISKIHCTLSANQKRVREFSV